MRNIKPGKKYFEIWLRISNLEMNNSKPMKNHPFPTWQAEKEFCESAHLVFICRPWKDEHILKILLSYFTSWWQKMVVACLTKKVYLVYSPVLIFCIISEKRWKWCSPGVLLEAGVHSLSKLLHPGIREVKIHKNRDKEDTLCWWDDDRWGLKGKTDAYRYHLEISLSPLTSGLKRTMALRQLRCWQDLV